MHLLDKYKLPNSSESVVEQFFNQLFSDAEVFIGIHDKKVSNRVNIMCCSVTLFHLISGNTWRHTT